MILLRLLHSCHAQQQTTTRTKNITMEMITTTTTLIKSCPTSIFNRAFQKTSRLARVFSMKDELNILVIFFFQFCTRAWTQPKISALNKRYRILISFFFSLFFFFAFEDYREVAKCISAFSFSCISFFFFDFFSLLIFELYNHIDHAFWK